MSHELHELYNQDFNKPAQWRFVSDGVMGGQSQGNVTQTQRNESGCACLEGQVSLANNGGFIQMQLDLQAFNDGEVYNAQGFDGLYLEVLGNSQEYSVHLRTSQLWLPWQSFRQSFKVTQQWQRIYLPFTEFESYKTFAKLDVHKLKRLGLLAIGREFQADVCVRSLGFYKNRTISV